jgi:hypothetical protein|tara:strand:+ start:530 stop:673 length:144 start_codon:yes stop_codon:yes gene_type:complete
MENEDKNKNQRPSRMINIAFPKAKYGFYIAIFIIAMVLLILYGNLIL